MQEQSKQQKSRFKIEQLEERIAPSVTSSISTVKIPGPTDAVVTTATNPGGNHPPGHQSVSLVPNHLA